MEYGILMVEDGAGGYQVVAAVSSVDEARELAWGYGRSARPDWDCAPEGYVIHRRDERGRYTVREEFDLHK